MSKKPSVTMEAATSSVGDGCTKPWIVPSTIFSGPDPCQACIDSQVLIKNGVVQRTFVNSKIGQQFIIKPNRPSDFLVPSNFMAIELGNGSGASVYRENIINCAPVDIGCGTVYSTLESRPSGDLAFLAFAALSLFAAAHWRRRREEGEEEKPFHRGTFS